MKYNERRQLRILLVEDKRDTVEILSTVLELYGHQVQTAGDAVTAFVMARESEFDVLVSDISLPGRSGLDLMRDLRSRGTNIPAIALSGYGQESDIRRSREAGFQAHLIKPVDVDRLLESIDSVAPLRNRNAASYS